MTLTVEDFDGAPAIDVVQFLQAQAGTGWISGCTPSLVTTDTAIRIDVTAGTVYVENTELQFSQNTIDLPDGDSTHPRKDIVYIDATNSLASAQGTPREPKPADEKARHTNQPEPPDLKDITNGQTAGCPIAEVWVPAGASGESDLSDGTVDYVRDRRLRPWADTVTTGSHADTHESGGSDTIDPDNLAGFDEAAQDAAGALATDGLAYDDANTELGLNVVATGSTTLSGGTATIDTGIGSGTTATFTVYLGPSTTDADVAADIRAASGGNYEVDIQETDTSVDPTVEYDIVRLR